MCLDITSCQWVVVLDIVEEYINLHGQIHESTKYCLVVLHLISAYLYVLWELFRILRTQTQAFRSEVI